MLKNGKASRAENFQPRPCRLNLNCRLGANAPEGTPTRVPGSNLYKPSPKELDKPLANLSIKSCDDSVHHKSLNNRLVKAQALSSSVVENGSGPSRLDFYKTLLDKSTDSFTEPVVDDTSEAVRKDLIESSHEEDIINTYISFTEAEESTTNINAPHVNKRTLEVVSSGVMNENVVQEDGIVVKQVSVGSHVEKQTSGLFEKEYSNQDNRAEIQSDRRSLVKKNVKNGCVEEKELPFNDSGSDASSIASPQCTPILGNSSDRAANDGYRRFYQRKRKEDRDDSESTPKLFRRDLPSSFCSRGRRSDYDYVKQEVEKYFNKRFCFGETNSWQLPDPSMIFSAEPWEVKELIECKNKLNAVKERLDDLDLSKWHAHTKKRNKAGSIIRRLRAEINPEFPTQAWCKFYENVSSFHLVPEKAQNDKKLRSVHLCEAPGAFITSLNHYLRSNFGLDFDWDWLATTLNPHYEGNPLSLMINEDRFILHTMDHWVFGEDQTGDLMCPQNLVFLEDRIKERLGDVLLVTADGSIDCQDDPGEQENYVAWLHLCEAITAMQILAEGGSFLLKIFTVFEHSGVCLLYLLCCAFQNVTVNKPATSKEGNSETYVVCEGYRGSKQLEPWLLVLKENFCSLRVRKALFPLNSIPSDFVDAVIDCADMFRTLQSDIIEANLESFLDFNNQDQGKVFRIRSAVTEEFFSRYNLESLPEDFDVVGRKIINRTETLNLDPRREVGSFSDKKKRLTRPDKEKILQLKEDLNSLPLSWDVQGNVWWYEFRSDTSEDTLLKDIQLCMGKAVKRINSSKFCLGRLLDIRNKVLDIAFGSGKKDEPALSRRHADSHCSRESRQFPDVEGPSCVLDFKNKLWASSDEGLNSTEEIAAFRRIIQKFDTLQRDDNLIIMGYPLLTQFNVGLVYLLGHSFQRVGLTRPEGQNFAVIFERHLSSASNFRVKEKLDEIAEKLHPYGRTVLAMLPIQKLCGGLFYKYVTLVNNLCVKEQILELIDNYCQLMEENARNDIRRLVMPDD